MLRIFLLESSKQTGLFLVVYLVVEFTDIYGNPGWFKAFLLILTVTFLIIGLSIRTENE